MFAVFVGALCVKRFAVFPSTKRSMQGSTGERKRERGGRKRGRHIWLTKHD